MVVIDRQRGLLLLFAFFLIFPISNSTDGQIRVRGSFGVKSYGYEDAFNQSHLWFMQTTNLSAFQTQGPFSFHFSGGYTGDNLDDFSQSGEGRFIKGYLQYGNTFSRTYAKFGRFFLHRGVALGTMDGMELNRNITNEVKVSVFAGSMAPLGNGFEYEAPDKNSALGAELKWSPHFKFGRTHSFGLSVINQKREDEIIRKRLGLTYNMRYNREITWSNIAQFRLEGTLLRRAITRLRFNSPDWNCILEVGIISPDIEDYSWFNGFESVGSYVRTRFALDRYIFRGYGIGFDGIMLMAEGSGFNGGPVVTIPWGKIGYRFSSGSRALSSGPWAHFRYEEVPGIKIYAYGSITTYEWEDFDIPADDLTAGIIGASYEPSFYNNLTLTGEFQYYSNPQYDSDRRALGGFIWRFDSGRVK